MKYFALLLFFEIAQANEVSVTSLGQGSCWFQDKPVVKISSFNDLTAVSTTFEGLESSLKELVTADNTQLQTLHLHCGSYGSSLVARLKSDNGNLCLWAMADNAHPGKWKIRTLGGTLDPKKGESKLCDGFKQGELMAVIKNHDQLDQLRDEKWASIVKGIVPVAFDIYKLKLTNEYLLHEEEAARILQESFGISIEFNLYQHGIGEYVQLK